ncbi:hypothetical protein OEG84_11465 [Hoeflea sp. G2-23]|uniref:Uncharacterized protein n=1 Tax=Hoeflea algicola TaxID=2983763 RepID=A0ABT3ZAN0_9HYPH|nr:hypothetical protein [Hoeflea algicola]MCY0148311.1 hypothetical protein [Hoeflea algicola]
MQTANIMLALGGDSGTTVPKYAVTASEIAVLRAIHGLDAVTEVEPTADREINNREEIARLRNLYGHAKTQDESGNNVSIVAQIFPGAAARAFRDLEELEIPAQYFKAEKRVTPKPTKPAAKKAKKSEEPGEEAAVPDDNALFDD